MKSYRGILFIEPEMLSRLGRGGKGEIWDAQVRADKLHVAWADGQETSIDLAAIHEKAELDACLPLPSIAFASGSGKEIGLLFESNRPLPGLQFVEPHSLVFPIGWLTTAGMRQESSTR